MNRIFVLMGKSSCGKDSIYKELRKRDGDKFRTITPYTTRPMREGEKNGDEYIFTDEKRYGELKAEGRIIEDRSYNTVQGLWRYYTVDDGSFESGEDVLLIGTLETYLSIKKYFDGKRETVPVYIECDDGDRLIRAVNREKERSEPQYRELCRRYLSDDEDFSEEKLRDAGIGRRFFNDDLMQCVRSIEDYIWT